MNDTWTAGTIAAIVISAILFCIALIASILLDCFQLYRSVRAYLIQRRLNRQ